MSNRTGRTAAVPPPLSTTRLIRATAAGSAAARDSLFWRTRDRVLAIARRVKPLARPSPLAATEDLADVAFLQATQRIAGITDVRGYLSLARCIMENRARDLAKAERREKRRAVPVPAPPVLQPADEAAVEDLLQALARETRTGADIVRHFVLRGLDRRATCQALGLSEYEFKRQWQAVQRRLALVLARLGLRPPGSGTQAPGRRDRRGQPLGEDRR